MKFLKNTVSATILLNLLNYIKSNQFNIAFMLLDARI